MYLQQVQQAGLALKIAALHCSISNNNTSLCRTESCAWLIAGNVCLPCCSVASRCSMPAAVWCACAAAAAAGLYPASADEYEGLASAIERLNLNDASVTVKKETSDALGAGFRCFGGAGAGRVQGELMFTGLCILDLFEATPPKLHVVTCIVPVTLLSRPQVWFPGPAAP